MSELETDEDLDEEFYDAEESQVGGNKSKKKSFYNRRKKAIRKKTANKNVTMSKDPDIKVDKEKKKPKAKKHQVSTFLSALLMYRKLYLGYC